MVSPDTVFKNAEAIAVPDAPVLPAPSRFDPKHIHEETTGTSVTQWVECFRNHPVIEDWFYEANVIPMEADVKWVDSLNSLDNSQLFDCKEEDFHTIDRTAAQSLIKRNLMTSLAYRTNVMPEGVAICCSLVLDQILKNESKETQQQWI